MTTCAHVARGDSLPCGKVGALATWLMSKARGEWVFAGWWCHEHALQWVEAAQQKG